MCGNLVDVVGWVTLLSVVTGKCPAERFRSDGASTTRVRLAMAGTDYDGWVGPFRLNSRFEGRSTGSTSGVRTLARAMALAHDEVFGVWTCADEVFVCDDRDRIVARVAADEQVTA